MLLFNITVIIYSYISDVYLIQEVENMGISDSSTGSIILFTGSSILASLEYIINI